MTIRTVLFLCTCVLILASVTGAKAATFDGHDGELLVLAAAHVPPGHGGTPPGHQDGHGNGFGKDKGGNGNGHGNGNANGHDKHGNTGQSSSPGNSDHSDKKSDKGNNDGNGNGNGNKHKTLDEIEDDVIADAPDQSAGLTCRQIQLELQDLVSDQDFKNHGHRVRFVVRELRRALRDELDKDEVSHGCFGCIVSAFAHKKVALEDQKVCGTHDICEIGEALDESDSSCAGQICAAIPTCCTEEWAAPCVAAVTSVCGETCDGGTTTTVPPTTTTVVGGTTTTIAPTTTTVPATTTTVVGGTTTTVPATTTTIVGGTTTTVPAPTTTVVGGTTTTVPATTTTAPATTTTVPGTTTTVPATTTTVPGTTTTVPGTTTTVPATTTTVIVTTTTVPVTTTTIGGSTECPTTAELTILAGTSNECGTNADCTAPATCNQTLGRCQTRTDLDTGYTGFAHNSDLTDGVFVKADITCPGSGPACGQCSIAGINPEPGNCRCSNDKRAICSTPLATDDPACATGATCDCYIGPPLSLAASGTPACVINKLAVDVSGTTNLDTGAGETFVNLKSQVFLGENLFFPCPVCGGKCTAGLPNTSACFFDTDCDTSQGAGDGVCGNYDPAAADGVRGGTCFLGANNGLACDVDNFNYSFPAPAPPEGGGHSLDCFPAVGKNVSGAGLSVNLNQTTGSRSLPSAVNCGLGAGGSLCPCGQCSADVTKACSSNADCGATGGTCGAAGGAAVPNTCNDGTCDAIAGSNGVNGECSGDPNVGDPPGGPVDVYCDGVVGANGKGLVGCFSNADCGADIIGVDGGNCTVAEQRPCFLPTIIGAGTPDPETPVGVAVFCIPKTSNGAINAAGGLPGPGRVFTQNVVAYQCTNGDYVAGAGCP